MEIDHWESSSENENEIDSSLVRNKACVTGIDSEGTSSGDELIPVQNYKTICPPASVKTLRKQNLSKYKIVSSDEDLKNTISSDSFKDPISSIPRDHSSETSKDAAPVNSNNQKSAKRKKIMTNNKKNNTTKRNKVIDGTVKKALKQKPSGKKGSTKRNTKPKTKRPSGKRPKKN